MRFVCWEAFPSGSSRNDIFFNSTCVVDLLLRIPPGTHVSVFYVYSFTALEQDFLDRGRESCYECLDGLMYSRILAANLYSPTLQVLSVAETEDVTAFRFQG